MNNNVNMGGMGHIGAPVGGMPNPLGNGLPPRTQRAMPVNENQQRSQLNTYIYEYFIINEMWDCAHSLINSQQPINVIKKSPAGRDSNGNMLENGDDEDEDSKDDFLSKRGLPHPNLPKECPESCFLYEWWCLFWDMFNAQRGKGESQHVQHYVAHTQQQSRAKQDHQQQILRQMRPNMDPQQFQQMLNMRNPQVMQQNELARKAMQNNGNRQVQGTPQQMQQMLHLQQHQQQQQQQAQQQQQQQQQQAQQQAQNQKQFQREGSEQQRPQSPRGENAPSPSKRPKLDGAPFAGGPQQGMMPNGRGQQQGMPDQQQMQNFQNAAMQGAQAGNKAQSLQAYTSNLVQHQTSQMPNTGGPKPNGPQSQGSPMMSQGQDGSAQINTFYNADGAMANMQQRPGVPGQQNGGAGNHALQDYQMQLMLLEQQNKKRLMMARQEQDSLQPRDGVPGGPGPNGQPFQGNSPQGPRSGSSPNPNDMKRNTPQLNAAGLPSPLADPQSRGSPGSMNFMAGNQMDPNMQKFYGNPMNGMEGQMGSIPVGMRPPSSHPVGFNGQMNQQQMMQNIQRQQQQGAAGQVPGWTGPNGTPMMQQTSQGPQPQTMGTPQQRAMPPPSAPAAAAGPVANGRTQPPSPQQNNAQPPTPSQANKANPKKGKKDAAPKKNQKKASATTGATPSNDANGEPATPTPATPITPQHNKTSSANNAVQGGNPSAANGQVPVTTAATALAPQQSDPNQNMTFDSGDMFSMTGGISMDFANPNMGTGDVLQDFDFDSFLHQDDGNNDFAFDGNFGLEGGEVGVE